MTTWERLRRSTVCSLLAVVMLPMVIHAQDVERQYRGVANQIIQAALRDSAAYRRLTRLVDQFGSRLSGSPNLELAIDWILEQMRADGLANVRGEPVLVPRWVRGNESLELLLPRWRRLPMLGLGGSVGTPTAGTAAQVLVVNDWDDLAAKASHAQGKIVLYVPPWENYGRNVDYRRRGAIEAAKLGAVASLIASVTPYSMQTPHTGSMSYQDDVTRIPHAAITLEDARMLRRMQDAGERIFVRLTMDAQTLPDVESRNVVAEVVGREFPEQVVVLGGHIDSWDVGQGAMDDGGGAVAAWEAVRLIHALGLRPRRTIRVVMWTNEENGLRGGNGYRDAHAAELDNHILAIESDGGVFKPQGFGFTGSDRAFAIAQRVGALLSSIDADSITRGGGGADIGPIMERGVPGMGLNVEDSRYFWYHHTDADTIDKLDPREVAECVATLAVMAYVVADLPERLAR